MEKFIIPQILKIITGYIGRFKKRENFNYIFYWMYEPIYYLKIWFKYIYLSTFK